MDPNSESKTPKQHHRTQSHLPKNQALALDWVPELAPAWGPNSRKIELICLSKQHRK